ncbi:response regulator transcription factor [Christensenellaceae bacterium NSJ-53]|uniref:Stage 0 sporulation protein A homolog n=2 Tax=Gehongia tenuis TaxID=2763655 RepID=A0A926D4T0_9FIRM|nr:response regulator transcription factor [Gehongia tenuis]
MDMAPAKILVVEDDGDINVLLQRILTREGYLVSAAYSGSEAKLLLDGQSFDLVLLDLMLPGLTGEALIRELRKKFVMPVIVVSARSGLEDKMELLRLGADDYITKPFEAGEVLARVEAQLRRYRMFSPAPQEALVFKNLKLDLVNHTASVSDKPLSLTAREFEILALLMRSPERVYTRENLYEQVWNGAYLGEDNTVNVHISNIRQKLTRLDPGADYIKTVWGIGFKMNTEKL